MEACRLEPTYLSPRREVVAIIGRERLGRRINQKEQKKKEQSLKSFTYLYQSLT